MFLRAKIRMKWRSKVEHSTGVNLSLLSVYKYVQLHCASRDPCLTVAEDKVNDTTLAISEFAVLWHEMRLDSQPRPLQ